MYLFRLAWRNVFRNIRRSGLCCLAVAIGVASMIIMEAFIAGMADNMIASATSTWTGHAQVHHQDFMDTQDVDLTVPGGEGALAELRQIPGVAGVTARVLAFSMLASAANSLPVQLIGVDPHTEPAVSDLHLAVRVGSWGDALADGRILLGHKLAADLEVELGDRVVVTSSMTGGQGMAQQLFRVGGVFRLNMTHMDSGLALVSLESARQLIGAPGASHEIALRYQQVPVNAEIPERFQSGNALFQYWTQLMPSLDAMLQMIGISRAMMVSILFLVVGLGVVNTLFMAIYERMYEFGILRAVGTRPVRLFKMILYEAATIGILAAPLGALLALGFNVYFLRHGVDFSGTEFSGVTITRPIFPVLQPVMYALCPAGGLVLTVVAAVWPAVHAARIVPATAMRKSL